MCFLHGGRVAHGPFQLQNPSARACHAGCSGWQTVTGRPPAAPTDAGTQTRERTSCWKCRGSGRCESPELPGAGGTGPDIWDQPESLWRLGEKFFCPRCVPDRWCRPAPPQRLAPCPWGVFPFISHLVFLPGTLASEGSCLKTNPGVDAARLAPTRALGHLPPGRHGDVWQGTLPTCCDGHGGCGPSAGQPWGQKGLSWGTWDPSMVEVSGGAEGGAASLPQPGASAWVFGCRGPSGVSRGEPVPGPSAPAALL